MTGGPTTRHRTGSGGGAGTSWEDAVAICVAAIPCLAGAYADEVF
jgi:hypothetical protein